MELMTHQQRRQRRQQIADFIGKGASVADACERFEVGLSTVDYACKEHGVLLKRKALKHTAYAILADLMAMDGTVKDVAERHGVTWQSVYQMMKKARAAGINVKARRKG